MQIIFSPQFCFVSQAAVLHHFSRYRQGQLKLVKVFKLRLTNTDTVDKIWSPTRHTGTFPLLSRQQQLLQIPQSKLRPPSSVPHLPLRSPHETSRPSKLSSRLIPHEKLRF